MYIYELINCVDFWEGYEVEISNKVIINKN